MKENNYTILNIREYLENAENGLGENDLIEILSDFPSFMLMTALLSSP